jgi:hypothetical protein
MYLALIKHYMTKADKSAALDPVAKKMNNRAFRDSVIETEEIRWNTPKKQVERINEEKKDIKRGLSKYAAKVVKGIKNMKKPIKNQKELCDFLKNCGFEDEAIDSLEKASKGLEPRLKHLVLALHETVNALCGKNLSASTFTKKFLQVYEKNRKASFLPDEIEYVKCLDRHGEGFYSSVEGRELVKEIISKTA